MPPLAMFCMLRRQMHRGCAQVHACPLPLNMQHCHFARRLGLSCCRVCAAQSWVTSRMQALCALPCAACGDLGARPHRSIDMLDDHTPQCLIVQATLLCNHKDLLPCMLLGLLRSV